MSKRLSKARRAEMLNRKLVVQRAKQHDDSHLLQQGAVKCALARPAANLTGLKMPRQSEGHSVNLDRKNSLRANPTPKWDWDYTKVKGYKPIER